MNKQKENDNLTGSIPIILASGSQARRNIVSALSIPFVIKPADIDEKSFRDTDLRLRAEKIAIAKAEKVAGTEEGIIISADTFCVHESGRILEKPTSLEEAREMLLLQSNSCDRVITGFCYIDKINNFQSHGTAVTQVHFREFSEEEIDSYVKNMPVLTWSGAFYPGQPYGASMIRKVNGSLSSFLYGLPTEMLIPNLIRSGIKISAK